MLLIKTQQTGNSATFRLDGELTVTSVPDVERSWKQMKDGSAKWLRVDVCHVNSIDAAGQDLLNRMFGEGVELMVSAHGIHSGHGKPGCA